MKRRRILHPRKKETRRIRKRKSKMKCQRVTRKNSNLPPFNAGTCPDMLRKGADGMYLSSESINGVFTWKKIITRVR